MYESRTVCSDEPETPQAAFVCNVTTPSVALPPGVSLDSTTDNTAFLEPLTFLGEGRRKADAKRAAAAAALEHLRSTPLWAAAAAASVAASADGGLLAAAKTLSDALAAVLMHQVLPVVMTCSTLP